MKKMMTALFLTALLTVPAVADEQNRQQTETRVDHRETRTKLQQRQIRRAARRHRKTVKKTTTVVQHSEHHESDHH
ncbi:MAG TPA: hypothetical protein VGR02_18940 [Thermoanaerobaculia bacterium]|jgi:hypothetical protein|nr:hypothetical protein [Thermoanaerobaculia bacterium]